MDKEINIAGKKIFYRVVGKGEPVMLIHGFGETGDVWKNTLTDHFLFIIPDLPGSGKSELVDDMSMEGMAEVLKSIFDKEGLGSTNKPGSASSEKHSTKVSLVGHSMGGYVVLAFVEKYASLLRSYGLFHSTAFPDSEEKIIARRKSIEFIKEHGAFEFLKTSTPNLFSPKTKEELPGLVDQFLQSLKAFSGAALISYYESMIKRPDRTDVLKNTNLPVLLVLGEYDTAIPINDGSKLFSMPEKAYIHVLHESGHMGMLEEPENSNRLLDEFLSAV